MATPISFVIFGGTGDLMRKSIIPSLRTLAASGRLPVGSLVIGVGRRHVSSEDYAAQVMDGHNGVRVLYVQADAESDLTAVKEALSQAERGTHQRVFYCVTPPQLFAPIAKELGRLGLADGRIVLEKPFGLSLASAKKLDSALHRYFSEERIYRVDHYLGKDAVRNLMVLRFANPFFERTWSNQGISQIRITVDETSHAGERIGYYDSAGVVRDMVQNHLLQLASFILMDAPKTLDAADIRRKKADALDALRLRGPEDVVLGQYEGYAEEAAKAGKDKSATPTFVLVRLWSKSRRWKGVPIVLRTGKALKRRHARIEIGYHKEPCVLHCVPGTPPNRLVIDIQPTQDIHFTMQTQTPGGDIKEVSLDFCHDCTFGADTPEAYATLLGDIIDGDKTLFVHADELYRAWRVTDAIIHATKDTAPTLYPKGSDGPA